MGQEIMGAPLADLLATHFRDTPNPVVRSIFTTDEPASVADMVTRCAREQLQSPVAGGAFYRASSGCVIGLHLADGRNVVMKAHQSRWEPTFLEAVQHVQRTLCARGVPCAAPIAGPVPIGRGWATVEEYLADPGQPRPFDADALAASSAGLVALIAGACGVEADGLERHPLRVPPGELYPVPHNPIFDLAATGAGAEWIDDIARTAMAGRECGALPPVVAHLDWSANNVRLGAAGVTAVYDMDSLSLAADAVAAGQAAATWRSTGESGDTLAPDAAEVAQFVAAFASARGAPFSPPEVAVAHAAAVWVMAYTARCEHALEARTPWRRTRARDWLRTQAGLLL